MMISSSHVPPPMLLVRLDIVLPFPRCAKSCAKIERARTLNAHTPMIAGYSSPPFMRLNASAQSMPSKPFANMAGANQTAHHESHGHSKPARHYPNYPQRQSNQTKYWDTGN